MRRASRRKACGEVHPKPWDVACREASTRLATRTNVPRGGRLPMMSFHVGDSCTWGKPKKAFSSPMASAYLAFFSRNSGCGSTQALRSKQAAASLSSVYIVGTGSDFRFGGCGPESLCIKSQWSRSKSSLSAARPCNSFERLMISCWGSPTIVQPCSISFTGITDRLLASPLRVLAKDCRRSSGQEAWYLAASLILWPL